MEVLYIGKMCDEDIYKMREIKQQPYFVAQYMYEKALFDEMDNSDKICLTPISIYQTEYFPKDRLFIRFNKNNNYRFRYLSFINLPILRELSYFIAAIVEIYKWKSSNHSRKKCIYSSTHFAPVSAAVILIGYILKIPKIITFTDLSLFTYSKERIKKMSLLKRIVIKPYIKLINYLQTRYDSYILFSKAMNKIVNKRNKPSIVIEGIYNNQDLSSEIINRKSNVIAHAGTLNREVGIEKILNVFSLLEDPNLELWLIGKGDMVSEIISRSKEDTRIKFLGYMPRNQVFNKLKEASLLVNLRNPEDVYTRYSFPSKMFEYMASGTPVLTTRIEGIPEEYYQYVFSINTNDNKEIAKKINRIFNMSSEYLTDFGKKAEKFIFENKNSKKQTEKIIDFIDRIEPSKING
jgi:glycosyltransferase involved in cell wall biosynthesis